MGEVFKRVKSCHSQQARRGEEKRERGAGEEQRARRQGKWRREKEMLKRVPPKQELLSEKEERHVSLLRLVAEDQGRISYSRLHWACWLGDVQAVRKLLGTQELSFEQASACGADGKNCFDLALENEHGECLQLLLEHYAQKGRTLRMILRNATFRHALKLRWVEDKMNVLRPGAWTEHLVVINNLLGKLFVWSDPSRFRELLLEADLCWVVHVKYESARVLLVCTAPSNEQKVSIRFRAPDSHQADLLYGALLSSAQCIKSIAAAKVQAAWRGKIARGQLARLHDRRRLANKLVQSSLDPPKLFPRSVSAPSAPSRRSSMIGLIKDPKRLLNKTTSAGPGKPKRLLQEQVGSGSLNGLLRLRRHKGALRYWSKPKHVQVNRALGCVLVFASNRYAEDPADAKMRLPFADIVSVFCKEQRHLVVRSRQLGSAATMHLLAAEEEECAMWYRYLYDSLPRENMAALTVQSMVRAHLARKRFLQLKRESDNQLWETAVDTETNQSFFYLVNGRGRRTTWTLPRGWIKSFDEEHSRPFYYNTVTQHSCWTLPPGLAAPAPAPAAPARDHAAGENKH